MAIVIRDGDIINIKDQNILTNNKVKQVIFQEKSIQIDDKNINTDRDKDGLYTQNVLNAPFSRAFHSAINAKGLRIEIFQSNGSFTIDKEKFPFLTVDNIQWTMSGSYVEQYKISQSMAPTVSQMENDNESCSIGYYFGMEYKSKGDFTQTGYWGVNGIVTLTNGGNKLTYNDRDYSNIEILEGDTQYTINFNITTTFIEMQNNGIYYSFGTDKKVSGLLESQYVSDTIRFDLYVNGVTVKDESQLAKYGESNSLFTISFDTNSLYQKKTTIDYIPISEINANKILNDWGEGKESVTIEVGIGEYYDENGDLVISTQDNNLPMLFEIGQMVVPHVSIAEENIREDNVYVVIEEKGLSEYKNGLPKRFIIYDIANNDDGLCTQTLKLVESNIAKSLVVNISDNITDIILTRMSSPTANAPLGIINNENGVVYLDDTIKINIVRKEEYQIGYNSMATLNEEEIVNDSILKVEGDWDIYGYSVQLQAFTLSKGSATVTRTSSPAGAILGELSNTDILYEGDVVIISYSGDIRTYTITMGGELIYSGSDLTELNETITITGDLQISITAKQWHWVNYGTLSESPYRVLNTKDYNNVGLTWEDKYIFESAKYNGVKAGLKHEFVLYTKFYSPYYNKEFSVKEGNIDSFVSWGIPETTGNDSEVLCTTNYVGAESSMSDAVSTVEYQEFIRDLYGLYTNCLKINVVDDGKVEFTSIGNFYNQNTSTMSNNYFTGISENFVVRQYEYS